MTTNIDKKATNNNLISSLDQPLSLIMQVLDMLETDMDEIRARYSSNYQFNRYYKGLADKHQMLSAAISEMKFEENSAQFKLIREQINQISINDTEIGGFIITVENTPFIHSNYALIDIPYINDSPEMKIARNKYSCEMLHDIPNRYTQIGQKNHSLSLTSKLGK